MRPDFATRLERAVRRGLRAGASGLLVAVVAGGLLADAAVAQHDVPLVFVEFDPGDYGLARATDVRRGRVSLAWHSDGVRLNPYYLRSDPVPPRVTYPDAPPLPDPDLPDARATRETALWVWQTARIMRDADERAAFLDFVEAQGITRVFLHLAWAEGDAPRAGFTPFSGEEIGPLIADLRARGALTYGLDGDPDFVREENHAGVWRTVERMVEYNRSAPEEQRFYGIRYDIEPYLVPGFQGPFRQRYLDAYVRLLGGVSRIGRAAGLRVAVDIPFWFDAPDEESGIYMEATLDGRRAGMLDQILGLVDDIAIMDYRTEPMGANGALAHSYHELELAEAVGVDVFVGVETVPLVDEDLHTFFGPFDEGLPPHSDARWIVLEERSDGRGRLWLVDGAAQLAEVRERSADAVSIRYWPAGRPIRVGADAQSFHNLGPDAMRSVTNEIIRYLSVEPAFAGLAFHDYYGLRELLGRREGDVRD